MASPIKLLIISCSGEETSGLADRIHKTLRKYYGLEEQVELLTSRRKSDVSVGTAKDHKHPFICDFFPDCEVQADIGRNELYDIVRGKHVVLVQHLLTPNRLVAEGDTQRVSVNDNVMIVRGVLDLLKNTDTLQRTLVAPYLSYVRSHSVAKYAKRGFFQFDSLRKTLIDYQRDGLSALLAIDPHSQKAAQIAEDVGIDFHTVNPFQSARAINPYKLGLSGKKAEEVMKQLRPFQERFVQLRTEHNKQVYVVAVDEGTETRAENFIERAFPDISPNEVYAFLAYFSSDRRTYDTKFSQFQPFSQINEANIDPSGTYIIIDDMAASLGTANGTAKQIKERGGAGVRVELWTSHAVTMPIQHAKANERNYIDKVVCLDTVPQHPNLDFEYIPASSDLLSAGLYKIHQRLVASR